MSTADSLLRPVPRFIAVDRMIDGLMLEFADGEGVLFPYAFLYARLVELRQDKEQTLPKNNLLEA